MKEKINILSLDIGKQGAIVLYDNEIEEYIYKRIYNFISFRIMLLDLEAIYHTFGVNVIVIGEAFGQRCVVKRHSKFYGVIELFGEKYNIPVIYVSDMTARAVVLGKGFGHNKAAVHEKFKGETRDSSDAMLFVEWYLKSI